MGRRRAGPHRAGGGGGGGCGVVLATAWDDNFDCGSSIDTAGTRFSGANAWTPFGTGPNFISANLASGDLTITTSSNGLKAPRGATMAAPSGDWTFETPCAMASSGFLSALGIILIESGTSKYFTANFTHTIGSPLYVAAGDNADVGTYGFTAVGAMSGTLEVARISGNLRMRYDIGAGWVTLVASLAQTTPFTTAPDQIGLFVQNETTANGNAGVFDYWHRTA